MSDKVPVVIADDEEDARELMKIHLARHKRFELVGEARNGNEAVEMVQSSSPRLVFLDINMPGLTGLEVVTTLTVRPHIIFVTAYDEFAVKAFELNALDYLLKPFSEKRFDDAIRRFSTREVENSHALDTFLSILEDRQQDVSNEFLQRISFKQGLKTVFIDVGDITHIEAADQYVEIHTLNGKHLVRQSMDYLEQRLDPEQFFRTHRSSVVRLSEVVSLEQYEPKNALIHLKSGATVKLSQSRKQLFQAKLGI